MDTWKGDGEKGDKRLEWSKQTVAADNRIQIVTEPVLNGSKYAYRIEVRSGDNPSGCRATVASGPTKQKGWGDVHLIKDGDEGYYGLSVYLPSATFVKSDKWRLVLQFKGVHTGSPPISLNVRNDYWLLNNRPRIGTSEKHLWTHPVQKDVYERFMMHIRWSSDPATGFVELYHNDACVLPLMHTSNIHVANGVKIANFVALGLYRAASDKIDVLYHDGFCVGASYEDVKQG